MLSLISLICLLSTAQAKPAPAPITICPWSGKPAVGDSGPAFLTVSGVKYKVGKSADILSFKRLLGVCGAGGAIGAVSTWKDAQDAVAAQTASMSIAAVSVAAEVAAEDGHKKKQEKIGKDGAVAAAVAAVVLAQLSSAAARRKEDLILVLEGTSAPSAGAKP